MKIEKTVSSPAPTFPIGLEHHFIEDKSRDCLPHYPTRIIPISIFYPGKLSHEGTPARYVDIFDPSVDEALTSFLDHLSLTPEQIRQSIEHAKSFRLSSFSGIDANKLGGPYPVILYSPGGDAHRFTNVPVLERIAAGGYVVVTIDHPYEGTPVVYPNGDVFRASPADENFIELTLQRVKDTRLVLDYFGTVAEIQIPEFAGYRPDWNVWAFTRRLCVDPRPGGRSSNKGGGEHGRIPLRLLDARRKFRDRRLAEGNPKKTKREYRALPENKGAG